MNNNYLVTIAIPVYGVENYIETCARSIFEQTYTNIEYVFIDDCTKDNSITILEDIIKEYPNRQNQIKIIKHHNNRGLAASRNTAVKFATGEFIFNIDSDDYIDKNVIEILVKEQIQTNSDLVVGNHLIELGPNQKKLVRYCNIKQKKEDIIKDCLNDKYCHSVCGILIKRSLYINNNIKAIEGLNIGEDWLVASLLLYHSQYISYIDFTTYHYIMQRPNSYTISSLKSISKKKESILQFVSTIEQILLSFSTKEICYTDILYQKLTILIQDAIIYCCKDNDKRNYKSMVNKLNLIPSKYLDALGKNNPFFLMLKKNFYIFKAILKIKSFNASFKS